MLRLVWSHLTGGEDRYDPFDSSVPYPPITIECDVVTVSQEHFDHNGRQDLRVPRILRAVVGKGSGLYPETIGDVRFRTVASSHDDTGRFSEEGPNGIFVMEMPG